jgi:hypothetical protein
MRIISVAGATSKAGKTLLAEQLIRYCVQRHEPVWAVKFTTTSDLPSPCPRGAPCTVCDLSDRFRLIRDPEILGQPGKNTARLLSAGATDVVWVVARKSALPIAYEHLLTHLPTNSLVIMEGSTVTSLCKPDLLFYVYAQHISRARWKESAQEIMARAQIVIENRNAKMVKAQASSVYPGALALNLAETPATDHPQIAAKLDELLGSRRWRNTG